MRRVALALAVGLLLAGCGGSKQKAAEPETALLKDVQAEPQQVVFEFKSAPGDVKARFRPLSQIAEAGSGAKVDLQGRAALVVTFFPAATADIQGEQVVPTYTGPKRLRPTGSGSVQEVVKIGDFEAQLDWAIGLDRRGPFEVKRDGARVTVTFGT
jgi:hypothetical protein